MKQQTAVEWLIEQLRSLSHSLEAHLGTGDIRVTQGMIDEFEEQAKQMEKKQIEDARPQITSNCVIKEISDEEIEKAGWDYELNQIGDGYNHHFIEGAKWYREQLKKK